MRYYIITGEASGDMHGANLIKALKKQDPDAQFRGWGGDRMEAEGAELAMNYRDTAFMGFKEVLFNIHKIIRNLRYCKADIARFNPDAVILIDYPGFNLRIAQYAKEAGYPVIYYISPQVWAWKASRVKKIKQYVDKMLVILPFEEAFYQKWDYQVDFVGHPLLDVSEHFEPDPDFKSRHQLPDKPIVALIPGSRKQEINTMLPEMLKVAPKFPDYQFVVAGAPGIEPEFYKGLMPEPTVPVMYNETYQLLSHSKAAMVTSGTATLETALFEVPELVCYKGNAISYWIAKRLVNIDYIALVNLILQKEAVKELIQKDFSAKHLEAELRALLENDAYRQRQIKDFKQLKSKLGHAGASERAARHVLELRTQNSFIE